MDKNGTCKEGTDANARDTPNWLINIMVRYPVTLVTEKIPSKDYK